MLTVPSLPVTHQSTATPPSSHTKHSDVAGAEQSSEAHRTAAPLVYLPPLQGAGGNTAPVVGAHSQAIVKPSSNSSMPYTDPRAFQSWIGKYPPSDQSGDLSRMDTLVNPPAPSSQLKADLQPTPAHHTNIVPFPQASANRSHPSFHGYAMQEYERNSDDRSWHVMANFDGRCDDP